MKNKNKKNSRKEFVRIACPDQEAGVLEGLIDLLVIKGLITEQELNQCANLYQSYMNALIDLLVHKNVITEQELEAAIKVYHDAVRALAQYPNLTPDIVFDIRRKRLKEILEVRSRIGEK